MRDYKNIKAYQLAAELVIEIYKVTKAFPKEEIYGLTSQLRRAAVSVPTNIAEGASRNHKRDYLQFLYISRGSLAEVECLLQLGYKLDYLDENKHRQLAGCRDELAKMLFGLIRAVESEVKCL
ncbi:MAG: four helix bundle protein [bacterium]